MGKIFWNSDKVGHKSGCTAKAKEDSKRLGDLDSRRIVLSMLHKTKQNILTDQLSSNSIADLRLCLCICKKGHDVF